MTVPGGVEKLVSKAHDEDVLDHLLAQVVVDTEDLLFLPVGLEGLLEVARALQVLTEGLLDLLETNHEQPCPPYPSEGDKGKATYDDTGETVLGVAVAL